jgi:non-heme chloroperoxidase
MTRKRIFLIPSALIILIGAQVARSQDTWVDKSPHKSGFITANGIRLHYLDWGGKGEALLFLAGASNSAHIFDDRFRVLALTRRGHGQSDKPETGYDTSTLVEDIRQFLDRLHIKRIHMVGHSLAGDEMTRFAGLYPERVDRLIYLDAAYDRAELASESFAKEPFPPPPPTKEDTASLAAYREWWKRSRGFWSDAAEADLRETALASDGTIKPALPRKIGQAIFKGTAESRPDYAKVRARALALYAAVELPPWIPPNEDARQKAQDFLISVDLPYQRKNIEKFRREMRKGRVIELRNSNHYLFITNQDEVIREMRKFLLNR